MMFTYRSLHVSRGHRMTLTALMFCRRTASKWLAVMLLAHACATIFAGEPSLRSLSIARKHKQALKRRQNIDGLLTSLSPLTDEIPVVDRGLPLLLDVVTNSTATRACEQLEGEISSRSSVIYVGAIGYLASADHYFGSSITLPACVFRPATGGDLSLAMKVIAKHRILFAVSSGKHSGNPGFSSTTGIQIDLRRFSNVGLSRDGTYVDVGTGLVWDAVYTALEGSGRTVLGGRTSGVGVGGYLTGGAGYSYLIDQYGPCVESIIHFDVVLPNGKIAKVSDSSLPDLFFALKGGGNQFGIVFNARLKTFPIARQVWGGTRFYIDRTDYVRDATYRFLSENKDPKAVLIPTFNWLLGLPLFGAVAFYDGAQPPKGTFAGFDDSHVYGDWGPTTLAEITQSQLSNVTSDTRGRFHTVSIQRYSPAILQLLTDAGERLSGERLRSGILFSLVPENAFSNYGRNYRYHSPFPYGQSQQPNSLLFTWASPLDDSYYVQEIKKLAKQIHDQAIREGQQVDDLALYPNYALDDTPATRLYGQRNLQVLRRVKAKYDPDNIMGLTTYFKL